MELHCLGRANAKFIFGLITELVVVAVPVAALAETALGRGENTFSWLWSAAWSVAAWARLPTRTWSLGFKRGGEELRIELRGFGFGTRHGGVLEGVFRGRGFRRDCETGPSGVVALSKGRGLNAVCPVVEMVQYRVGALLGSGAGLFVGYGWDEGRRGHEIVVIGLMVGSARWLLSGGSWKVGVVVIVMIVVTLGLTVRGWMCDRGGHG